MQLVGTHDFQMMADAETCGWRWQALRSGPWSHMHWEAHLPFLGRSATFDQELPEETNTQTKRTNHDSERCEYFQPWNDYKKTDLNEWIILMIKEKQIELFLIGLLSSFYLDESLLLLVKGPLKSADWTRPVKLAICFSMACILSL